MIFRQLLIFLFSILCIISNSQNTFEGKIQDQFSNLAYAQVMLSNENHQFTTTSDKDGAFLIQNIPDGSYQLKVSYIGYLNHFEEFELNTSIYRNITLQADPLLLEGITITSSRTKVPIQKSPIKVNALSNRLLRQTQSTSLSEGIRFSPGLRVENNCQNCGFTQVRMNGLEGAYSQILINNRPIFSALAGVYGLEMIPSNMIERIEVIKGGGSSLYGGNAIAGTINIITKDPTSNSLTVGSNLDWIEADAVDRHFYFNTSLVSDDLSQGITIFGFDRNRDYWDANQDGFSEITLLEQNTLGMNAFWELTDQSRLQLQLNRIQEYRRGGNDFDLKPHQSDIAEELNHRILSADLSYEFLTPNKKHKLSIYSAMQQVRRNSYYGGGGRLIEEGDSLLESDILAINAYGNSEDITIVGGGQHHYTISENFSLTSGIEFQYNDMNDEMAGYRRFIDQQSQNLGAYSEINWSPLPKWKIQAGGRFDHIRIHSSNQLESNNFEDDKKLNVFVPRAAILFQINDDWQYRASYAEGYRAPQAFNEDLHIETVGGAALFIQLDPALNTERSNSFSSSISYTRVKDDLQLNFGLDAFYTKLQNPFLLSNPRQLTSGIAVIEKRNGEGAHVYGTNLEMNLAWKNLWTLQSGFTIQDMRYETEETIWQSEEDPSQKTSTMRLLRTPHVYGYTNISYNATKKFSLTTSMVFTGSMEVPHVVDPNTERTIIESTPSFFEQHLRLEYTLMEDKNLKFKIRAGVKNIWNAYQDDFDLGADRDASYVYGPILPRTYFVGLEFSL